MRSKGRILGFMGIFVSCCATSGDVVNVDFCPAFQQVHDNQLLLLLDDEYQHLFQLLLPDTADLNGASHADLASYYGTIEIRGNGMLDCSVELALLQQILANPSLDLSASGGIVHRMVHDAWVTNEAQLAISMREYWPLLRALVPGLAEILLGYLTIGDGSYRESPQDVYDFAGSGGVVKFVLDAFVDGLDLPVLIPPLEDFVRLPQYLGAEGDADGDGVANRLEYEASGGDTSAYAANALDPNVYPTAVHLTSPNGGERWYTNTPVTLRWTSVGDTGTHVKLKLFKGGRFDRWISGPTPDDGAFVWTIPADIVPATDYRVQVYSASNFALVDFSDADFQIAPLPLSLTTPNGGETWTVGSAVEIVWNCDAQSASEIKLKLFKGRKFDRWIAGPTSNDGSFTWKVPHNLAPGTDYRVQIYSASEFAMIDMSDAPFMIALPSVMITHPNGGENFLPGDPVRITWLGDPFVAPDIKLKLLRDDYFYGWISGPTPNDGYFEWFFPSDLPRTSDYRVQIYSASDFARIDQSDASFTITDNRLRLLLPNGTVPVVKGTDSMIMWNSAGETGSSVKLKLFRYGKFLRWVSGPTPNVGRFLWSVPPDLVSGDGYKIQIYSATDFSIVDMSDTPFTIFD